MIARLSNLIGKASAPFLAKAAIAAGAVIVVLLTGLTITGALLLDARETIGTLKQGKAQAIATAENNHESAVRLAERLSACVNVRALDRRAQERAQTRWERRVREIESDLLRERQERDESYATVDECADLRRCRVCADIERGLRNSRDRARNKARPGNGRDDGPGPGGTDGADRSP